MSELGFWGLILGGALAAGINLYLVAAGLGVAHRLQMIVLPGQLEVLGHPLVIGAAVILYIIEFAADKIPIVDSFWDAIHTFVRPFGGALLVYLAMSESEAVAQTVAALLGGGLALETHLLKAGTRAAINTSPEPVSNWAASLSEDAFVLSSLWLMIFHPAVMLGLVLVVTLLAFWLLPKLFRLLKRLLSSLFSGSRSSEIKILRKTPSAENS